MTLTYFGDLDAYLKENFQKARSPLFGRPYLLCEFKLENVAIIDVLPLKATRRDAIANL